MIEVIKIPFYETIYYHKLSNKIFVYVTGYEYMWKEISFDEFYIHYLNKNDVPNFFVDYKPSNKVKRLGELYEKIRNLNNKINSNNYEIEIKRQLNLIHENNRSKIKKEIKKLI